MILKFIDFWNENRIDYKNKNNVELKNKHDKFRLFMLYKAFNPKL